MQGAFGRGLGPSQTRSSNNRLNFSSHATVTTTIIIKIPMKGETSRNCPLTFVIHPSLLPLPPVPPMSYLFSYSEELEAEEEVAVVVGEICDEGEERSDEWKFVSYIRRQCNTFASLRSSLWWAVCCCRFASAFRPSLLASPHLAEHIFVHDLKTVRFDEENVELVRQLGSTLAVVQDVLALKLWVVPVEGLVNG